MFLHWFWCYCYCELFVVVFDGQVSSQELGDALKALGSVTPEEVQRMMAEIDTDGDGFISHDTDGDGFISHEEFINFARANRGLVRDVAKIFGFLSSCS